MAVVASVPAGSIDTSLGDPNTDYTTFSVELWLDANGPKVEVAQGAMLIGLMLGCLSFGLMLGKAASYFRANRADGVWVLFLIVLNFAQLVATFQAAYHLAVIAAGDFFAIVRNEWSVILQVGFATTAAAVVQSYFAFRLYTARRSRFFLMALLLGITVEMVLAWYSVGFMFHAPWFVLEVNGEITQPWSLTPMFAVSAVLNAVIAVAVYVYLPKPYVRRSVMNELEYWAVQSLFGCALISALNAGIVARMGVTRIWLPGTFALGNLYTLSVILSLRAASRPPSALYTVPAPVVIPPTFYPAPACTHIYTSPPCPCAAALLMPPPELHRSVSDHASTATMLNGNVDLELEKDLAKAEKIKEAEMGAAHEGAGDYPPEYAGSERSRYSAGYNTKGMV